jgi:RNA polymerase sigma-70 factor (ECF subfamily)
VRLRDRDALGRFFDLAFPYVYNLAYRFTRHRETAEDITQEVFIKVHKAAHRVAPDRSAKPWLTAITVNACRDEARRRRARPEDTVDSGDIGRNFASPATPEAELLERERNRQLERALGELDWESRLVVLLHDYCGLPHDEIAGLVQNSHDAVRKRHSRAIKRLSELVQREDS